MSDTPRTDKKQWKPKGMAGSIVPADFARELERENAKLRELVVNLRPYGHMLLKGERPVAAYSDALPYILADADAVKL